MRAGAGRLAGRTRRGGRDCRWNLYIADTFNGASGAWRRTDCHPQWPANGSNRHFRGDNNPATGAALFPASDVAVDARATLHRRFRQQPDSVVANGIITRSRAVRRAPHRRTGSRGQCPVFGTHRVAIAPNGRFTSLKARSVREANGRKGIQDLEGFDGGILNTLAGIGTPSYSGDGGTAGAAQLNGRRDGDRWLRESLYRGHSEPASAEDRSRGTIATIAGTGTPGYSVDFGAPAAAQSIHARFGGGRIGNVYLAGYAQLARAQFPAHERHALRWSPTRLLAGPRRQNSWRCHARIADEYSPGAICARASCAYPPGRRCRIRPPPNLAVY